MATTFVRPLTATGTRRWVVPHVALATEDEIDSREHELKLAPREMTDPLDEQRSIVTICETLATESFDSPVVGAGSRTLPGASAQWRLLVIGIHTTVEMRLRLNGSPCTTITGLLARLPVAALQDPSRRRGNEFIARLTEASARLVELLDDEFRIMPSDVFRYGIAVELAARLLQPARQPLRVREYLAP